MRELLKQYLTEKQNSCLLGGRLREVVAMKELTVGITWKCQAHSKGKTTGRAEQIG